MAIHLPEGFRPHTFASLLARFQPSTPSLGAHLAMLACPTCDAEHEIGPGVAVIQRLEDAELIQFAEKDSEPAFFVAAEHDFLTTDDKQAAERLLSYFQRAGSFDTATGEVTDEIQQVPFDEWLAKYEATVVRLAAQAARCSIHVVRDTLYRWAVDGTLSFVQSNREGATISGAVSEGAIRNRTDRLIMDALYREFGIGITRADGTTAQPEPYQHRSYMRAVEAQYAALANLEEIDKKFDRNEKIVNDLIPEQLWGRDIRALKLADTFCWFPDALHAVDVAAASLPTSVQALRDMTEQRAGWWFFMEPYPLRTTKDTSSIVGLLWSWVIGPTRSGVTFTVYVASPSKGTPIPTTSFLWEMGTTLDQMLVEVADEFDKRYNRPGAPEFDERWGLLDNVNTMHVVERLARLFAAGTIWLQQKILVYTEGRVERHERKRMARGLFQRPVNDVQIVELRRRMSVPMEQDDSGGGTPRHVDWQCRWIVRGHWREQWHPSTKSHKTKFIDAYPKGPEDMPLKVPTHTIYKVAR